MKQWKLLPVTAAVGLLLFLFVDRPDQPHTEAAESATAAGFEFEALDTDPGRGLPDMSTPASVGGRHAEPEPQPAAAGPATPAGGTATFLVTSAADGAPLGGATLWAGTAGRERNLGSSDESGLLVVEDLPSFTAGHPPLGPVVWFKAAGFSTRYVHSYEESIAGAQLVSLLRNARLDVFVVDAAGQPLEGVLVRVSTVAAAEVAARVARAEAESEGGARAFGFTSMTEAQANPGIRPPGAGMVQRRETDSGGYAAFEDLPANEALVIEARADGALLVKHPGALKLPPGTLESLTLTAPARHDLRGRVVDAETGEPLANLPLWAFRHGPLDGMNPGPMTTTVGRPTVELTSGPAGQFELEDVLEGVWYIGPAHDHVDQMRAAERLSKAAHGIHAGPGLVLDDIELRLNRGLFVAGIVIDDAGQPVADVGIRYQSQTAPGAGQVEHVGEDGTFRFGPLEPGVGFLSMAFSRDGLRMEHLPVSVGDLNVTVRMTHPNKTSAGLELELVDSAGQLLKIHGIIVSRGGRFIVEKSMSLAPPPAVRVNVEGSEPVDVCVTSREGPIAMRLGLQLGAPGESLKYTLVAQPSASLRLSYTGTQEFVNVFLLKDGAFCAGAASPHPGQTVVRRVPTGTITLRTGAPDGPVRETFFLNAGDERELEIDD